jgi:hypothetical protein
MITRHMLRVSCAIALTVMAAGTASSQTSPGSLPATTTTLTFLSPLPSRYVIPSTTATRCREPGRRCPPILVYGGKAANALPTIEPAFKANLPHVRVSFVLQEISNKAIANGGVNDSLTFVEWTTTSGAASVENGGPYGYPLPPPGNTWDSDDLYHTLIYDALVFNACGSFASFPVTHDAVIDNALGQIGAFHGVDNSTLDHTGLQFHVYGPRDRARREGFRLPVRRQSQRHMFRPQCTAVIGRALIPGALGSPVFRMIDRVRV